MFSALQDFVIWRPYVYGIGRADIKQQQFNAVLLFVGWDAGIVHMPRGIVLMPKSFPFWICFLFLHANEGWAFVDSREFFVSNIFLCEGRDLLCSFYFGG